MTSRTGLIAMLPFQWPPCEAVVETDLSPGIRNMTTLTSVVGIVLSFNGAGMDVFMTVYARTSDIPKHPFVFL
jgi:hypothetical protein